MEHRVKLHQAPSGGATLSFELRNQKLMQIDVRWSIFSISEKVEVSE